MQPFVFAYTQKFYRVTDYVQYKGTVHTVTYGHMSHGDEISASFSEAVDKALALYGQADDQTKQDFRTVRCKDWIRLDDWTTKPEKLLSSRILGEVWKGLKFWRAKPLLKWLDIYPLNADSHQ